IKSKIQIMTAHASKGLEFSHVFLGGIYTNGRKNPSNEDIGMKPGSFKWSPDGKKTSSYTTPQFILEKKQHDLRDFSEGKRLFHVACTRGKDSLYWADLEEEGMDVRSESDSWINALRAWGVGVSKASSYYENEVCGELGEGRGSSKIPFFHYGNLGLF